MSKVIIHNRLPDDGEILGLETLFEKDNFYPYGCKCKLSIKEVIDSMPSDFEGGILRWKRYNHIHLFRKIPTLVYIDRNGNPQESTDAIFIGFYPAVISVRGFYNKEAEVGVYRLSDGVYVALRMQPFSASKNNL